MTSLYIANLEGDKINLVDTAPKLYLNLDNEIRVRIFTDIERAFRGNIQVGELKDKKLVIDPKYIQSGFIFDRFRTRYLIAKENFIKLNGAKEPGYAVYGCNHPLCKTKEEYEKSLADIKKTEAVPVIVDIGFTDQAILGAAPDKKNVFAKDSNIFIYASHSCEKASVYDIANGKNDFKVSISIGSNYYGDLGKLSLGKHEYRVDCKNGNQIMDSKNIIVEILNRLDCWYYDKDNWKPFIENLVITKEQKIKIIQNCAYAYDAYSYTTTISQIGGEERKYASPSSAKEQIISLTDFSQQVGKYNLKSLCETSTKDEATGTIKQIVDLNSLIECLFEVK